MINVYRECFELLTYHNVKNAFKVPIAGNENILTKTCIVNSFIFLDSKTQKHMDSTLYGETEQHYPKHES